MAPIHELGLVIKIQNHRLSSGFVNSLCGTRWRLARQLGGGEFLKFTSPPILLYPRFNILLRMNIRWHFMPNHSFYFNCLILEL